ncbi:hypothetical protein LTR09_005727 [Extremus antarcticus]|uniref:Uncharacterized protein n=1 Tax=Extremus antarcticus TaxID=702011 RepID=A0AAJ0DFZ5_9PEZI|nr:hypothetical protein LTR09_005727 [Extremus antarcticus]
MCLLKVKDEPDYSVPARVREVKRTRHYSQSPPRASYVSKTRVVEERKRSSYDAPAPPPPPPAQSTHTSVSRTETRRSEAPSPPQLHDVTVIETRTPRADYVEVHHDDSSDASVSSSDDVRSRTKHKTSRTSHTQKSSKSRTAAPASEYSIHEKEQEIRRERAESRPRGEYETYQYVNAPPNAGRSREGRESRGYYDPRASSGSHRRVSVNYYR